MLATVSAAEDDGLRAPSRSTPQNAGGIGVSPGGHYLTYQGETLLLVGDSGTHCVMQNVNIDHRQWIDACAARGLRAVHVWSFMPPRQKQDGSGVESRYGYVYPGVTPWARRTSGPNALDGLKQWDLTKFDDGPDDELTRYWPRLRDLISYARSQNIVVGITVFFGFPKHNQPERPLWSWHPFNVVNGGFLTETKKIVTAPQTIHSPGIEVWRESWSDDWPPAKKTQWVWERFALELLRQTMGFGNVFYVFMDEHSYPEGNGGGHFLKFFKQRGALWMDWGRRRESVDLVCDQFLMRPNHDLSLAAQFGKPPARPFFGLEEGGASGFNYTSDLLGMVWRYAIAGGHYFHHNDELQETVTTGIMVFDPHLRGGQKEKVLERLDWLGHASRFFNQTFRNLDSMAPHNELVSAAKETYCLANPGVEYAVYSRSGEAFALDLSAAAAKTVSVRFYDPSTGKWTADREVAGGGKEVFQKPNGQAWAFHAQMK